MYVNVLNQEVSNEEELVWENLASRDKQKMDAAFKRLLIKTFK